jgi:radical SAM protein with 4Fe4S-binding SPASM domain
VSKYEPTLSGIKELLISNNERGKPVEIYLEIRGSDRKSLFTSDFIKYIMPNVDDYFIRNNIRFLRLFDSWGGLIKENNLPAGKALLPNVPKKTRPCRRTFHAAILLNGDLRICDCRFGAKGKHDELVIGSINANSLDELWNGSAVRVIRRSFNSHSIPDVCDKCGFYYPV